MGEGRGRGRRYGRVEAHPARRVARPVPVRRRGQPRMGPTRPPGERARGHCNAGCSGPDVIAWLTGDELARPGRAFPPRRNEWPRPRPGLGRPKAPRPLGGDSGRFRANPAPTTKSRLRAARIWGGREDDDGEADPLVVCGKNLRTPPVRPRFVTFEAGTFRPDLPGEAMISLRDLKNTSRRTAESRRSTHVMMTSSR